MREEPLADFAAGEPRLPVLGRAAQDAEDVELRGAQAVRLKQLEHVMAEGQGEALHVEIDLVLEARVFGRLTWSRGLRRNLLSKTCCNDNCCNEFLSRLL